PSAALLTSANIDAIADLIRTRRARRIIVMSGAGISTAAGIPDFRTPGTGLYDNLQRFDLPYAEAIFDIDYFRENPHPFYALARELYPGNFQPTLSHYFVRLLAAKGLLLRHYTQNIDTLERVAGLDPELLVEAHGSFHTAHCVAPACRQEYSQSWLRDRIRGPGSLPLCIACENDDRYVKPDITFFGEALPSCFFERLTEDFPQCDLLIVMGTSLQVEPFASLIDRVPRRTPRLLVNLELCGVHPGRAVTHRGFDFDGTRQKLRRDALYLGSCDDGCLRLAELLEWKEELVDLHESENRRLR
ncbi:Sirt2 histone deacetylase, partial [Dimargaris cristalligena]